MKNILLLLLLLQLSLNAAETSYQIHTKVTTADCGSATGSVEIQLTNNYCTDLLQYIVNGDCQDYDCYFDWLTILQLDYGVPVPGWWYNLENLEDWYINGNHNIAFSDLQLYLTQFVFVNCELTPKMDGTCNYNINLYDEAGTLVGTGANITGLSSGVYRAEVLPNSNTTSLNGCFEYYDFCAAEKYIVINDFDLSLAVSMKGETCAKVYNYNTWPADYFSGSADGYLSISPFNFNEEDYSLEWFDFEGNLISEGLNAQNLKMTPLDFNGCYNQLYENYTLKITDANACNYYQQFIIGADNYTPIIQIDMGVSIRNRQAKVQNIKMDYLGDYFDDFQYNSFEFPTWINGEQANLESYEFLGGSYEIEILHNGLCSETFEVDVPYYCYSKNCDFQETAVKIEAEYPWEGEYRKIYRLSNNKLACFIDDDIELFKDYNDTLVVSYTEHCEVLNSINGEPVLIAWANCIDYKTEYDAYIEGCGELFDYNFIAECSEYDLMGIIGAIIGEEDEYLYEIEGSFGFESGLIEMTNNEGVFVSPALPQGSYYTLTISNADQTCVNVFSSTVDCHKTPIDLLSFNAETVQNGNLIQWQTASVIDEDYFVLEYSTNGIDFSEIARLVAVNHHAGIKSYQYNHTTANCKVYYRLKTIDFSGTSRIVGNIKELDNCNSSNTIVHPTITNSVVYLQNTNTSQIGLFNQLGQKMNIEKADNQINISHLQAGIYYLKIDESTFRIVKF